MKFDPGSLIKARNREWIVLHDTTDELLLVKPLGGLDSEITAIMPEIEDVKPASFDLPTIENVGDSNKCKLFRDAVRFSSRSSTGPFRSFARINVEPRPYQLVPLLMALKLDPVRLLIADDVGIGKTVEASMILRELLDRGEISKSVVLCPPHLAEQWKKELELKFNIDAKLVLSNTAHKLERQCRAGESLFEHYDHFVVSLDFIKTDRRRAEFRRTCPEFVIIDEAHVCAYGYGRGKHQRNKLIKEIAADIERHIVLVTATPHSGKLESFRDLLSLLHPKFKELPDDLSGSENKSRRKDLARFFVQRRRGDISSFLDEKTPFPQLVAKDFRYDLSREYREFFDNVVDYARDKIESMDGTDYIKRVRWWSILALLRAVGSSPAAAFETLKNRTPVIEGSNPAQVNEIGRLHILDLDLEESTDDIDFTPGSDHSEKEVSEKEKKAVKRRLNKLSRQAQKLMHENDKKLQAIVKEVQKLVNDGHAPILFCRFIATCTYVAKELTRKLPDDVEIRAITGLISSQEREDQVQQLGKRKRRVLVATDCLSEGVNLQDYFDTVIHYDLSWNPTRHEQREGRVDRYGQSKKKVYAIRCYSEKNPVDGMVLDVIIDKYKKIKSDLGISVPIPADMNSISEAIIEGIILKRSHRPEEQFLPGFEDLVKPRKNDFHNKWQIYADKERRSRTMFAQEGLKTAEVFKELRSVRDSIGTPEEVIEFADKGFSEYNAHLIRQNGSLLLDMTDPVIPGEFRDMLESQLLGSERVVKDQYKFKRIYMNRTHPAIAALAAFILDTTLDPILESPARRTGVIATKEVDIITTLLLVRYRFDIVNITKDREWTQLAEETVLLSFENLPKKPRWLEKNLIDLLQMQPTANVIEERKKEIIGKIINNFGVLKPYIDQKAHEKAEQALDSHRRVRKEAQIKGIKYSVKAHLPADILGIYVYLPDVELI